MASQPPSALGLDSLCAPCRVLIIDAWFAPDAYPHPTFDDGSLLQPRRRLHKVPELRACACPICKIVLQNIDPLHLSEIEPTGESIVGRCRDGPDDSCVIRIYRPCDVDGRPGLDGTSYPSWDIVAGGLAMRKLPIGPDAILEHRVPSSGTNDDESIARIRKWLEICCTSHSLCSEWCDMAGFERKIPDRVLDLDIGSDPPALKLIRGSDVRDRASNYATLSHCWGGEIPGKLILSNLETYYSAIPFDESLPKTFRDAVTVARKLAIPYLWIDALCIVQDSEDDWRQQAALMGQYYAGSFLNLSASASVHSSGGLFRTRDPHRVQTLVLHINEPQNDQIFLYHDLWDEEIDGAQINTRGWVVQERYLAPRIVHFGHSQLYWECCMDSSSEFLPLGFSSEGAGDSSKSSVMRLTGGADHSTILDLWDSLIPTYTYSNLTVASDRPVAIAGIARVFCHYLGLHPTDYVYGLWKPYFIAGLMWQIPEDWESSDHGLGDIPTKFPDACNPTWSWVSWNRAVEFSHNNPWFDYRDSTLKREFLVEPIDLYTSPVGDPFGSITSACVRLRGPLCRLKEGEDDNDPPRIFNGDFNWLPVQSDDEDVVVKAVEELDIYIFLVAAGRKQDESLTANGPSTDSNDEEKDEYTPYYGRKGYQFLMLLPTGAVRGQYRRIGVTSEPWDYEDCDRHLRSFDVPEDCYEAVDDDFMYTITLV